MNCQQVSSIGYKDAEKVERPRSVAWSPRKNISTWLGGFMQIYFVLTWWPLGKKKRIEERPCIVTWSYREKNNI